MRPDSPETTPLVPPIRSADPGGAAPSVPRPRGWGRRLLRAVGVLTLVGIFLGLSAVGAAAWVWTRAPQVLCQWTPCIALTSPMAGEARASLVFDAAGQEVGRFSREHRRVRPLDDLPVWVVGAFLAVEDHRFFTHQGVDWWRLGGAVRANVRARGVSEGFSTITMQLARNLWPDALPARQRTLQRKWQEMVNARQIEAHWDKRTILTRYLNTIYLGAGAYGLEAAAQTYFGKGAELLTPAEAALLAGLPKAPSANNPWRHPAAAMRRRNVVLSQMRRLGLLGDEETRIALASPVGVRAEGQPLEGDAPRDQVVEAVRREAQDILGARLYTGGWKLETTYQPQLQDTLSRVLGAELDRLRQRDTTWKDLEAGFVLLDWHTGAVAAVVGGHPVTGGAFNRAMQARRPVGSLVKPWIAAAALERGWRAGSWVPDGPVAILQADGRVWTPRGAGRADTLEVEQIDDTTYTAGLVVEPEVTLSHLLTWSRNAAAIHLGVAIGLDTVATALRRHGLWDAPPQSPVVPSLLLGAFEQTPWRMAEAFSAVVRPSGMAVRPRLLSRIVDAEGRAVWSAPTTSTVAPIDSVAAQRLRAMLRNVVRQGTAASELGRHWPGEVLGKTGTTNGASDVWFMGATPQWLAVLWMGADQPHPLGRDARTTAGALAVPVWRRLLEAVVPDSARRLAFTEARAPSDADGTRGLVSAREALIAARDSVRADSLLQDSMRVAAVRATGGPLRVAIPALRPAAGSDSTAPGTARDTATRRLPPRPVAPQAGDRWTEGSPIPPGWCLGPLQRDGTRRLTRCAPIPPAGD